MSLSRREFLKRTAGAGLAVATADTFLRATTARRSIAAEKRTLVILELNGGNDSLNTILPSDLSRYARARPKLAIPESSCRRGKSDLLFAPGAAMFAEFEKCGRFAAVESVGYPRPNRSHFRSMDIWQSAQPEAANFVDGWIGRAMRVEQRLRPEFRRPLFFIGDGATPLALIGGPTAPVAIADPEKLQNVRRDPKSAFRPSTPLSQPSESAEESAARRDESALDDVIRSLDRVADRRPARRYPRTALARQFEIAAGLILDDFRGGVFHLRLDGFDTHAAQILTQAHLLSTVGAAIDAFLFDLEKSGRADDLLIVVFSEFGRRVAENGSGGTDHGAGGAMYFIGSNLRSGRINDSPDLENLEDGDIASKVDFRTVYAEIVERHLGLPTADLFADVKNHPPIRLFRDG